MTPLLSAVVIGGGVFLVLFSAHYALDHLTPTFKDHPPRAYSAGVGILALGCLGWSLGTPAPGDASPHTRIFQKRVVGGRRALRFVSREETHPR